MKNYNQSFKRYISILLVACMIVCIVPVGNVNAEGVEETPATKIEISADNVTMGRYNPETGALTGMYQKDGYPWSNLVDGDKTTFSFPRDNFQMQHMRTAQIYPFACVNLGQVHLVNSVALTCTLDTIFAPYDFEIQVSKDGSTWNTVKTVKGYQWTSSETAVFSFDTVKASYVRIVASMILPVGYADPTQAPDDAGANLELAEFEVYYVEPEANPNKIEISTDNVEMGRYDYTTGNLTGIYANDTYPWSNLVDGDVNTFTFPRDGFQMTHIRNNFAPYARVSLGSAYFVDSIALTCTSDAVFAPYTFDIQVSNDNSTWSTVKTVTGYQWLGGETAVFSFDPVVASYVRIVASMILPEGYTNPADALDTASANLRLAELEVYYVEPEVNPNKIEISADTVKAGYYNMDVGGDTLAGPYGLGATQLSDYPFSNLVDGDKTTVASSANGLDMKWIRGTVGDGSVHYFPFVRVGLGSSHFVDSIALTCTSDTAFAPYDFMIQVSGDGTNWTTVKTVEAYQWIGGETATFTFDFVEASYVQIVATMVVPVLNGTVYSDPTAEDVPANASVYLRLAELEVYKSVACYYVDGVGSGEADGSSADNAFATVQDAINATDHNVETTVIVICGDVELDAGLEYAGKVVFTSVYDDVDYQDTASLKISGTWNLNGNVSFENITFASEDATVYTNGYALYLGENCDGTFADKVYLGITAENSDITFTMESGEIGTLTAASGSQQINNVSVNIIGGTVGMLVAAEPSTTVTGTITVSGAPGMLDLTGKDVTAVIPAGAQLPVIDTTIKQNADGSDNGGTLTKEGEGSVAVAAVDTSSKMRFLAVAATEGDATTYKCYPFNLTISRVGINTIAKNGENTEPAICVRASFMAFNEVIKGISEYGFVVGGEDYKNDKDFATNITHAYADVTASLNDTNIGSTTEIKAYIIINGERFESASYTVDPDTILSGINESIGNGDITLSATQKANLLALKASSDHTTAAGILTNVTE